MIPLIQKKKFSAVEGCETDVSCRARMGVACVYSKVRETQVQLRLNTYNNRFLGEGYQGNGFLSHICSEENRGENKMKKSANRLRARMPLIKSSVSQVPAT